jgi:hypothetical protein
MTTRLSSQLPIRLDIQPLKLAAKDSAAQGGEPKRERMTLCRPDIGIRCLTRVMGKAL